MELLVKRAMNGDGESFIQLMETYRESMLKVAWGFFSNQEDVADAMQQTILNAYELRCQGRRDRRQVEELVAAEALVDLEASADLMEQIWEIFSEISLEISLEDVPEAVLDTMALCVEPM